MPTWARASETFQFSWVVASDGAGDAERAAAMRTQAQIVRHGWAAAEPPSR